MAGPSPPIPGFNPRQFNVRFVVGKVPLGQVLFQALLLAPVSTTPFHRRSVIIHPFIIDVIILANNVVVK